MNMVSRSWKAVVIAALALSLNGCGLLLVGGAAAVGADSLANRRSTGAQADDQVMELRVKNNALKNIQYYNANNPSALKPSLAVVSYNRSILLLGQVSSLAERQLAEQAARSEKNVRNVYNYIDVSASSRTWGNRNYDTWITSKIRTRLLPIRGVYAGQIKVVTYNGTAYVMGLLTPEQQTVATETVRNTSGVQKVVTLYETYHKQVTPQ